jgi:hypothetical protein
MATRTLFSHARCEKGKQRAQLQRDGEAAN